MKFASIVRFFLKLSNPGSAIPGKINVTCMCVLLAVVGIGSLLKGSRRRDTIRASPPTLWPKTTGHIHRSLVGASYCRTPGGTVLAGPSTSRQNLDRSERWENRLRLSGLESGRTALIIQPTLLASGDSH